MARKSFDTMLILQILVALLLLAFGLSGLVNYNSTGNEILRSVNQVFGGSNDVLPLVFSIVEVICGALLIAEFFMPVATKFVFIGMIVICVVWLIGIISGYFAGGFFKPDFITWLAGLSKELIILLCFWLVGTSKQ